MNLGPIRLNNLEPMKPNETLDYIIQLAQSLEKYAINTKAMLAEADERWIKVDIASLLAPFEPPTGKLELQLIQLQGKIMAMGERMAEQGVLVTAEELRNRLQKMKWKTESVISNTSAATAKTLG